MPLKDLLWACPVCHAVESLTPDGTCRSCRGEFRRGRGARIVLGREGAPREELDARAWLARLPWPDLDGEGLTLPAGLTPPFEERVEARLEARRTRLRHGSDYLGTIEIFGPRRAGRLSLTASELSFLPELGEPWSAPLLELSAVQPSSSTIQLKARGRPVLGIRFTTGSVRLWEQRIKYCVRQVWRDAGKPEIADFQPRITAR